MKQQNQPKQAGILFQHQVTLQPTPDVRHELLGYKIFKYSDFTSDLSTTASDPTGIIAAILRHERRIPRQSAASRLFYHPANYGIALRGQFTSLPVRSSLIFNFGLSIDVKGYDSGALLLGVCDFLAWQMNQIKANQLLHLGEMSIPELQVLTSNQAISGMYWASAILSKYCDLIGVDRK